MDDGHGNVTVVRRKRIVFGHIKCAPRGPTPTPATASFDSRVSDLEVLACCSPPEAPVYVPFSGFACRHARLYACWTSLKVVNALPSWQGGALQGMEAQPHHCARGKAVTLCTGRSGA